jgi:hypothetical protein
MEAADYAKLSAHAAELASQVRPTGSSTPLDHTKTLIAYHLQQASRIARETAEHLTAKANEAAK